MRTTQWARRAALLAGLALTSVVAQAATDVGVSINIGQPGFYGRIDLGNAGIRPELVYAEPMIIRRAPTYYAPVYLRVPPGHQKKWSRYCDRYGACDRPVYFVKDDWYERVYVPGYRDGRWGDRHDDRREFREERREDRREYRDDRREDRREYREDRRDDRHDRGHGHGHGKGHKD